MTLRYHVSPAADIDLDEQAAYLADQAGTEIAFQFLDAATRTFEAIASMPGLGELQDPPIAGLPGLRIRRIEGFARHLVFYRPSDSGIEIVRILYGARDIAGIFEPEEPG